LDKKKLKVEVIGQAIDIDEFGLYFPNFPQEYKQVWEWEEIIKILIKESKKWRQERDKKIEKKGGELNEI